MRDGDFSIQVLAGSLIERKEKKRDTSCVRAVRRIISISSKQTSAFALAITPPTHETRRDAQERRARARARAVRSSSYPKAEAGRHENYVVNFDKSMEKG